MSKNILWRRAFLLLFTCFGEAFRHKPAISKLTATSAMATKKCFSLEHVARPSPSTSTPKSVVKVSALMEEAPQPPKFRKRVATAECVMAIFPYTKDATTVWDACIEQGSILWQVQLEHNARDSITVGFYESFAKFLQQEESAPDSVNGLAEAGIKLIVTDASDPDQVGFVRWRVAFYVAGDVAALHNFLYLLDEFFVWVNKDRVTIRSRLLLILKLRIQKPNLSHRRITV